MGFLLANAVADSSGVYGAAEAHYVQALAHGSVPPLDTEFVLTYGPPVALTGAPSPDPTLTG